MEIYKEVVRSLSGMSQKRKADIFTSLASEYPEVFMEIERGTFLPLQKEADQSNFYDEGYSEGYRVARQDSIHLPDPTEHLYNLPFWATVAFTMASDNRTIEAIKLVRSVSNSFGLKDSKVFVEELVKNHVRAER